MRRNEPFIDRLPELSTYRDTGCDLHPSCLTCPLAQCRYDDPGWIQREERQHRATAILQVRTAEALPVIELAARFGISTRTVHRVLSQAQPKARALAAS
jgi:hypothetical protein